MTEQWAAIPGHVGVYAVSDHGRVMSMNFARSGLPGIMKQQQRNEYLAVSLGRKPESVHRLVAIAFLGDPKGLHVNHKDGNKANNRLSNLEYCTMSENMKHAHKNGLQSNKGVNHSRAILDDEKVRRIRVLRKSGLSQMQIATAVGVSQSAISLVLSGARWGHVDHEEAKNLLVVG